MSATYFVGDAIEVMGKLPEKSVDLILTSPPFLALRSYLPADHPDKALEGGSQSTPGEFIDWLIDVVEACDRVLAPHGSLCIELGDTYAGSGGAGGDYNPEGLRNGQPTFTGSGKLANYNDARGNPDGMRDTTFSGGNTRTGGGTGWPLAKSLSLIPELFRFTLVYGFNPLTGRQTERWRLRNVVRWVRPNPPVGALGDKFRPATSELMVFCKSAKRYFDLDAVREPWKVETGGVGKTSQGVGHGTGRSQERADSIVAALGTKVDTHGGAPPLDWWNIPLLEGEEETRYGPSQKPTKIEKDRARGVATVGLKGPNLDRGDLGAGNFPSRFDGSPPLDWWNIPPGGYEGAHYAVWPKELLVRPIKSMCPTHVCTECGLVLDSSYDETGSSEPLRGMRNGNSPDMGEMAGGRSQPEVLLGDMPEPKYSEEPGEHEGLDQDSEGLHHGPSVESSNGRQERLRHGASSPNVGGTRQIVGVVGGRSPQERSEGRQPDRQLGTLDEGRPRQAPETVAEASSLPSLRRSDSDPSECPTCGGVLRLGRVLDPFAGSGTTLAVATGHGRDAIGIDLDERNYDLALERVGPFILERAG